jgi:hypothetical protein
MTAPIKSYPVGILARVSAWICRHQRELSIQVHAAGDKRARAYGWEITESTGRFGFGARSYRDPRFDDRRRRFTGGTQHTRTPGEVATPVDGTSAIPQ